MKLSRLLSVLGADCPQDAEITALACDSREVVPGALFAALPGHRADGRAYIADALNRGAAAVVCAPPLPQNVPGICIPADDPRAALALLAAEFYGRPAGGLSLIAVTGTKGKTTTAHMVRDILSAAGYVTGMTGTLGTYIGREKLSDSPNTTPEPIALHRALRQMADAGCTHVVMEASSQAMKLKRLYGLEFAAGLFLNLSPDHIGPGEHGDFEEYRACKAALFRQCRRAVGNMDDPAWPHMAVQRPPSAPVSSFGFDDRADVRALAIEPDPERPLAVRLTTAGAPRYHIPLPGRFNGYDALAAVALARALGHNDGAERAGLAHGPAPFEVVVDSAHNGASFDAVLSALREHHPRRIIAVFGAGGDRPKMRRTDMARSAARWADFAVLTEDNPRSERAEDVCADISAALGAFPHEIVPDRRAAIFRALDLARPGDVVALLGKGHEDYIEEKGMRRPFSEAETVRAYFGAQR